MTRRGLNFCVRSTPVEDCADGRRWVIRGCLWRESDWLGTDTATCPAGKAGTESLAISSFKRGPWPMSQLTSASGLAGTFPSAWACSEVSVVCWRWAIVLKRSWHCLRQNGLWSGGHFRLFSWAAEWAGNVFVFFTNSVSVSQMARSTITATTLHAF